jgi:hypothetical protein
VKTCIAAAPDEPSPQVTVVEKSIGGQILPEGFFSHIVLAREIAPALPAFFSSHEQEKGQ